MIRTFIAADIYPETKLLQTFDYIRLLLQNERISWTNPGQMHITIQFLGDTREALIPLLIERLTPALKEIDSFIFQIQSFGVFNSADNPRILWFGCVFPDQMLQSYQVVTKIISGSGHQVDSRPFKPHLTLGRVKGNIDKKILIRLLNEFKDQPIQSQRVEKIVLYESKLMPGGAIYIPIQSFSLACS